LPYGITRAIDKKLQWSEDFYVAITVFFACANSSNPIVYGIMDKQIRNACFQALRFRSVDVNKNGFPIAMNSRLSHVAYYLILKYRHTALILILMDSNLK
jgi:flavoprotein